MVREMVLKEEEEREKSVQERVNVMAGVSEKMKSEMVSLCVLNTPDEIWISELVSVMG